MGGDKVVAIVPVKPLHLSKSRLSSRLSSAERSLLSLNMLSAVAKAALDGPVDQVWVVGEDSLARKQAERVGARWLDGGGAELNEAVTRAFEAAFASDMMPMYLPADLPFLKSADVASAIGASTGGSRLVLSPSRRDGGTNAIVVPAGSPFRPKLGADSFRRHKAQAEERGLSVAVWDSPGLGLDLDTLDDLRAYEEMEPRLLDRLLAVIDHGAGGPRRSPSSDPGTI